MILRRFLFLLLLEVLDTTYADDFYVAAPNTLRLNADETIAVANEGRNIAVLSVFVQDFPGKVKNISHTLWAVVPGYPEIIKVRLNPSDFPPNILNIPDSPKYVSLNVHCDTFRKEIIIPLSTESGYVFIQMDKPIYTPKQTARMRIIPLNDESLPYDEVIKLEIRNPNGSIVEEKIFDLKNQETMKTFVTHSYKFPRYPVLGEWSAAVLYGYQFQQKNAVRFELQEYVLPTFTVEIKTPDVILPSTETITVSVLSKYVYGKKVRGNVTFRLGVQTRPEFKTEPVFFAVTEPKELVDGAFEFSFKTDNIKMHRNIGWFPAIKESHLFVEATVMEVATGQKEIAVNSKGRFNTSPFIISFKRCLKDFKPGHVSVFQADIYYLDGTPAVGIPVNIKALANNQPLNILQNTAVTDKDGEVAFEIQPELHHSTVQVTIETNDPRHVGSQAIGNFVQGKFESRSKAYIALARSTGQRLQPGDIFKKMVHFEPEIVSNIYYLVVARGKILVMNKLPIGQFKTRSVEFEITHEMVPSFRILVFADFRNELLADSLKIEVERVCHKDSKVSVTPEYSVKGPGSPGKFIIRGTKGTLVGLLGVDEAVYALSKKDLLTKSKVFKKFETHDLGCGPGGGRNIDAILGHAGIIIGTNKYLPSSARACIRFSRRKRDSYLRPIPFMSAHTGTLYSGIDYTCCTLGRSNDKYNRNCHERTSIVIRMLKGQYENCSRAFLDCCISAMEGENTQKNHSAATQPVFFHVSWISLDEFIDSDFIATEEEAFFEGDLTVRSDFKETWFFEDILIGENSTEQLYASLPHSITTWIVQAVSVSPTHGICVAEPQKLVSFKKIFLQLNLPYSVVRNERVEIQATVFNYGYKRIYAVMFMYGAKDLCTGVQPGEKSERKRLRVNEDSGTSVSFPVIPLKAGNITIKVVVLTPEGSDIIEKQLHVVYEGVPKEINIPIKLDPTNQQKRVRRRVNTELYSDSIDPDQNLQVTSIKLSAPEGFVPGTASCSITALGDQYGTVIETSVNNPDGLLQKPRGCGEQNMMYLAPTLYTVKYLKVTGKLTAAMEEKGYSFIRAGYVNQLIYRKEDGSYAAFPRRPTSGWLTAFVMKVLCQANELVHIDDNVLCSGVRWLINNQEPDGSYIERNPLYDVDLMGGVEGKTPMTAFTLIALEECKCDEENLLLAKRKALTYLEEHFEEHLEDVNTPLRAAIVAYALALSNSEWKQAANEKLLSMITTDEGTNTMYWTTPNAAQDIQTAGYGLLTQLLFNDLSRSTAIVNWLNTKQLQSGSFKSTQDTVIALQALAEYAIRARTPPINLVANISSSNDENFHHVLTFNEDNALMLQDVQLGVIGGTLLINTAGHGIGSLAVKLRYNLIVPPEEICKFHVAVNVSEGKTEKKERVDPVDSITNSQEEDMLDKNPDDVVKAIKMALDDVPILKIEPRNGRKRNLLCSMPLKVRDVDTLRIKRENLGHESSKPTLKISLCVRYLANTDAGMSIVDVGIFSGFEPVLGDLEALQDDPNHLIQRYEKSKRSVVFYLQKVPTKQNYCFSFRIVQKYLVGNAQTSVIKVYDYYNPDAACTKFYSPSNHSSVLHICEGSVCECAEDVCPPKNPFSSIYAMSDVEERRQKLKEVVCEKYNYVWKGKLKEEVKKEGGFLNISFTIDEVIKEGTEKKCDVEGKSRTLLVRDNCDKTCPILLGTMYLILGRDGQKYENNVGDTWYRYMLDKNSVVHTWTEIPESKNKELQRDLNYVTDKLLKEGCEL